MDDRIPDFTPSPIPSVADAVLGFFPPTSLLAQHPLCRCDGENEPAPMLHRIRKAETLVLRKSMGSNCFHSIVPPRFHQIDHGCVSGSIPFLSKVFL